MDLNWAVADDDFGPVVPSTLAADTTKERKKKRGMQTVIGSVATMHHILI